jgi:ABC-type Fe3+ transport system substrate-binding protein
MRKSLFVGLSVFLLMLGGLSSEAANLPAEIQKALEQLKLDQSVLKELDGELDVPKSWAESAEKEGTVVILGTWRDQEFRQLAKGFNERYPGVKVTFSRPNAADRGMKILVELQMGRTPSADVLTSIGDTYLQLKKMNALVDLRPLPAFKSLPDQYVAPDGSWVAHTLAYRCMAYNTNLVKKDELPKTWDDLVSDPKWRGSRLALSNNPNAWLLALWSSKGEAWGKEFTRKLFDLVPQQRKEGLMALTALTVAGEFYANLPSPGERAQEYANKGAPISYHCPDPVTATVSQVVLLEKSPHKNGAKLFINWLLSGEGQLLQYAASQLEPVNRALQLPQFIPFADTILGKPIVVRGEDMFGTELNESMQKEWDSHWAKSPGQKRKVEE